MISNGSNPFFIKNSDTVWSSCLLNSSLIISILHSLISDVLKSSLLLWVKKGIDYVSLSESLLISIGVLLSVKGSMDHFFYSNY